jgi:hypothetical protein
LDLRLIDDEGFDDDYHVARATYWAAYYGMRSMVKYYIQGLKYSPYLRTFKRRSVLMGAVCGG